jgi:hypothetical protein
MINLVIRVYINAFKFLHCIAFSSRKWGNGKSALLMGAVLTLGRESLNSAGYPEIPKICVVNNISSLFATGPYATSIACS